jgi:hypothetical protein
MSAFSFEPRRVVRFDDSGPEQVVRLSRLRRVLEFTGRSIDDVVNDPVARYQVQGFFKLSKYVDRRIEAVELGRQWRLLP